MAPVNLDDISCDFEQWFLLAVHQALSKKKKEDHLSYSTQKVHQPICIPLFHSLCKLFVTTLQTNNLPIMKEYVSKIETSKFTHPLSPYPSTTTSGRYNFRQANTTTDPPVPHWGILPLIHTSSSSLRDFRQTS